MFVFVKGISVLNTINTNSSDVIPPRESPSKKHSPEKTKTHLEGEYPYLWDLLAMLITHLQVLG